MVKPSNDFKPKRAKLKDVILLHYTERTRDDGSIVETTEGGEPKEFMLGNDEVNKSLEVHIVGMQEGESKTVVLPANKAYGNYNDKYVLEFDKNKLNLKDNVKTGDQFVIKLRNGKEITARLIKDIGDKVTLDANHVLAGKEIEYDLKLMEIRRQ